MEAVVATEATREAEERGEGAKEGVTVEGEIREAVATEAVGWVEAARVVVEVARARAVAAMLAGVLPELLCMGKSINYPQRYQSRENPRPGTDCSYMKKI